MSPQKPWISPEIVAQITKAGIDAGAEEACGIVTPDSAVVRLPNSSTQPSNSYIISAGDLGDAIEAYVERSGCDPTQLTRGHFVIWHTHPSGVVGPSAGDLRERLEGFQYVVVTLPGGEATQF